MEDETKTAQDTTENMVMVGPVWLYQQIKCFFFLRSVQL